MAELDTQRQRQVKEYARKRHRLAVINFVFSAILISVLILTPLSRVIAENLPGAPSIAAAFYLVILMIAYDFLTFPLSYWSGYKLPRDYGLLHQTVSGWISDHVKSLLLGAVIGAAVVAVMFFLIEYYPTLWWLVAWVLLALFTLLVTILAPVVLIPLFYKMRPLEEGELRNRLRAVANSAGVKISGIYIIEFSEKTTLANAAVMGLGSTKRIVISDTLINAYTPGEIDVVMAHELAHQRHADVWRLFGFQSAVYLGVFWLASWLFNNFGSQQDYVNSYDPAALPLLLFSFAVTGALAIPAISWFTRKREAAADAYALELTRKPDVFISAMTKLTDQNLGEARSSNFLERLDQDHPSYVDRVKMAQQFSAVAYNKNG
jgi:STE24 endopeptidase